MIRDAMRAVDTYNEIYEPTIKTLAKTERQLSRAEKEWRKQGGQMVARMTNKAGAEYMAKDPYWSTVEKLRADALALRTQLGLTPAGLKKARSAVEANASSGSPIEALLDTAKETAIAKAADYQAEVDAYVEGVLSGEVPACTEIRQACARYVSDLDTGRWDFRAEEANLIIALIETTICHQQGEDLDGLPMRGRPFELLPYHKFCVYNIMGFYQPGTQLRRYVEALIFVPRKNVKTTFAAALAWAFALYYRMSGSKVYEVGGALKQALEAQGFGVVHDTTVNDTLYNGSYDRSWEVLQKNLAEHPGIQVTIDVHRDSMTTDSGVKYKPTVTVNGRKAAQVMLIAGCDANGGWGDFPRWEENLRLDLRVQEKLQELFPGLARPMSFSNSKYNMNATPGSLLVEVGTEVNTVEEAKYSGRLVGEILAETLGSGE